jgi:nicotinate-nucleotide adenylyltransferase
MRKSAPFCFGTIRARPPHVEAGMRIGLLGGSFNPPHAAHRLISEIALRRLGLDRVWWLVTPGNPLKSHTELLPLSHRVAMARALANDRRSIVTDFEKDLGSPFTAATLGYLKLRYRGVRFVWLMGADCLAEFDQWRHWREIFGQMPIAVVDRPGWHLKALAGPAARAFAKFRIPADRAGMLASLQPPAWTLLTGPLSPLSSTAIRRQLGASPGRGDQQAGNRSGSSPLETRDHLCLSSTLAAA